MVAAECQVPSDDDELEYWDLNEEEVAMDTEETDFSSRQNVPTNTGELAMQRVVHLTLLFLLLWASHHGVSANALNHLIQYLHHFLASLGPYIPFAIANILSGFPTTLYRVRKRFGLHQDKFTKFTVCPSCHSLYKFENCYTTSSTGVALQSSALLLHFRIIQCHQKESHVVILY